jgi:hypothetical protein
MRIRRVGLSIAALAALLLVAACTQAPSAAPVERGTLSKNADGYPDITVEHLEAGGYELLNR